ncbi:MAG: dihydropteroate synthase [Coriobacteriia bacterium]|nr:dihydropteroate synthase [Coriobacteriia bacterium]
MTHADEHGLSTSAARAAAGAGEPASAESPLAGSQPTPVATPRVWRCGRFELKLDRPLVMGILNVTPDSFSDGGRFDDPAAAVAHAERLISEGAAILDVGGESTRPGAEPVPVVAELSRVRPVVLRYATEDVPVSVDTRHAEVAEACVQAGASIINDVSGFRDRAMVDVAVACDVGVVVMHMLGEPQTMQDRPYYDDVVVEVGGYLVAQATMLEAAGVARERIALDPGIGFGKSIEHNLELLRRLPELAELGFPLVLGVSRKRFIGEIGGVEEPLERLGGSIAAALFAAEHGANVLRVHDVAPTLQALAIQQALRTE